MATLLVRLLNPTPDRRAERLVDLILHREGERFLQCLVLARPN